MTISNSLKPIRFNMIWSILYFILIWGGFIYFSVTTPSATKSGLFSLGILALFLFLPVEFILLRAQIHKLKYENDHILEIKLFKKNVFKLQDIKAITLNYQTNLTYNYVATDLFTGILMPLLDIFYKDAGNLQVMIKTNAEDIVMKFRFIRESSLDEFVKNFTNEFQVSDKQKIIPKGIMENAVIFVWDISRPSM